MMIGDAIMKKTMVLLLTSAMLLTSVGCTVENNGENSTAAPEITSQAGVVGDIDNLPTAGVNHTLEPAETFYVPQPTQMMEVTPDVAANGEDMSEPFAPGAYAATFIKAPETAAFSAPGYPGYTLAKSKAAVEAYINKFGSMLDLSEFKEAADKYNDSFFTTKSLIIILHEEAEGVGCGRVSKINQFEDYVEITLEYATNWSSYADPNSVGTEKWLCLLEMNNNDVINDDVTVVAF